MQRLARVPASLLDAEVPVDRYTRLRLTEAGARVLAGDEDHVALNGIHRWIGGVHLPAHTVSWRWYEESETVRAACAALLHRLRIQRSVSVVNRAVPVAPAVPLAADHNFRP